MVNRLVRMAVLGVLAFSFGYGLRLAVPSAYAAVYEALISTNKIFWTRSGVLRFSQYVTSGNQMNFQNAAQPTPSDVYISTYNAIGIPRVTTAQGGALDPVNEGELIYNTDRNALCISTGVAIGSYGVLTGLSQGSGFVTASTATACGTGS